MLCKILLHATTRGNSTCWDCYTLPHSGQFTGLVSLNLALCFLFPFLQCFKKSMSHLILWLLFSCMPAFLPVCLSLLVHLFVCLIVCRLICLFVWLTLRVDVESAYLSTSLCFRNFVTLNHRSSCTCTTLGTALTVTASGWATMTTQQVIFPRHQRKQDLAIVLSLFINFLVPHMTIFFFFWLCRITLVWQAIVKLTHAGLFFVCLSVLYKWVSHQQIGERTLAPVRLNAKGSVQ